MAETKSSAGTSLATSTSYRLHGDKRQISRQDIDSSSRRRDRPSLLLFSNDRIKVSDFRLRPSQTAKCHHDHPTVRWQVAYDGIAQCKVDVSNADDGDKNIQDTPCTVIDRQVYFVDKGTTWEITNTSTDETEYRQIVFEFLSDQPNYTNKEIQELFAMANYSTDVGTKLVFENDLCRCWDFYLDPSEGGGADTVHHHCLDYVFINVAPSRLLGVHPETLSLKPDELLFDSVSDDNQVTWNSIPKEAATDSSFAHGGKNGYDDSPMREYLIELK
mmetsp:Transcript_44705/g.93791  ORF Transcript_44705/g.93791 Transcript_44705/m.93791 type:complete len:274 (+) Transcript_44705:78-899(+)